MYKPNEISKRERERLGCHTDIPHILYISKHQAINNLCEEYRKKYVR